MFIEITDRQTNSKILINKNHIINVWKCNDYAGIDTLINHHGNCYFTKESFEEIQKIIMS